MNQQGMVQLFLATNQSEKETVNHDDKENNDEK